MRSRNSWLLGNLDAEFGGRHRALLENPRDQPLRLAAEAEEDVLGLDRRRPSWVTSNRAKNKDSPGLLGIIGRTWWMCHEADVRTTVRR
jgi:hypothetical protein